MLTPDQHDRLTRRLAWKQWRFHPWRSPRQFFIKRRPEQLTDLFPQGMWIETRFGKITDLRGE